MASGSRMAYMSRPSSPAAKRARLAVSLASRASAAPATSCARSRHHHHAVDVGHHHVARMHQRAGAHHRHVDRAERGLDRALGMDGAAEHGKAHRVEVAHVAHATVDHQALAAARLERSGKQVAEEAVGAVAGAGRDHHVAGLDLLGRHVQHPVVARLQQHRDGRAAEARIGMDRTDARLHQPEPAERLVHGRDAEARELVGRGGIRARHLAMDHADLLEGVGRKRRHEIRAPWR